MAKQIINVGADPGGMGDGDTLRDAFVKTQANFDELYSISTTITDTSLDHSDPTVPGTIAESLARCKAAGGGIVRVGHGIFSLSSMTLSIGQNCQLVGTGKYSTRLLVKHPFDAIKVSSGTLGKLANWVVRDLAVTLPDSSSANGVSTDPSQASSGKIDNVLIDGGASGSYGINMNCVNDVQISAFRYQGGGGGIIWQNTANYPVNYGDSLIQSADIVLRNPSTTGIRIISPSGGDRRMNNILISRVEVHTSDGIVRTGTVGVHLKNAARITLVNVDIEHMETGLIQESQVDGGAIATTNAFIQVYAIGCGIDFQEIGTPPVGQVILGGNGRFSARQQLPSSDILVGHPIMGNNRILTAVRPIEAYANSAVPRVLTVADSGKIFTNKGAAGTVVFQLPSANLNYSVEYEFHLATYGYRIRIQPMGNNLIRPGQTASGAIYESDIAFGQVLKVRNIDGTTWSTMDIQGKWTSI
jgi:hypothetical protein